MKQTNEQINEEYLILSLSAKRNNIQNNFLYLEHFLQSSSYFILIITYLRKTGYLLFFEKKTERAVLTWESVTF